MNYEKSQIFGNLFIPIILFLNPVSQILRGYRKIIMFLLICWKILFRVSMTYTGGLKEGTLDDKKLSNPPKPFSNRRRMF